MYNFDRTIKGREFFDKSGTFSQFICDAFTWDDTPEGQDYWEYIHNAGRVDLTFPFLDKILPRTGKKQFESLSEVRQIIFKNACKPEKFERLMNAKAITLKKLIDSAFSWRETEEGHSYWSAVSEGETDSTTERIESEYLLEVEDLNGNLIPKRKAVKLNDKIYGADKYAQIHETIKAKTKIEGFISDARVLMSDVTHVRGTYTDVHFFHKSALSRCIEFEGTYYLGEDALLHAGILCIDGKPVRADRYVHAYNLATRKYVLLSSLTDNFVHVNQTTLNEVKIYAPKEYDNVYKCDTNSEYYLATQTGEPRRLMFVSEFRTQWIKVNPLKMGSLFEGQVINPVSVDTETGSNVNYASRQSAVNDGIVFSYCEHCNSEQSQHHDRIVCKRANFKNFRYDYHSQKPKRTYTNAEFKIGVEIEKESLDGASHKHTDIFNRFGWVKERDGSLNDRVGYELVSPAYNLFSNKMVNEAEALEARFPMLINGEASSACGGHIHFSRKHTSGEETLEMYCGYLPLLYAIYKGRTKQSYSHAQEKESMKHSGSKYQAVRVLRDRIEFRIFPAVKNLKSLAWRIELLRYMAKNPTASPLKVVNDLCDKRTALYKLFKQIFSEQTIYKRALDTLTMAKQYDRNYFNIDFTAERKQINSKAKRNAKK